MSATRKMKKSIPFEIYVECENCGWEGKVKAKGRDQEYDLPSCPKCGSEELKDIKLK